MALRLGQMALAVLGMWLVLTQGLVREPGWGGGGAVPVHWKVAAMPLAGGVLCIAIALVLIRAREKL